MINKINIVPRWVIFTIDLLICNAIFLFAYRLYYTLELPTRPYRGFWWSAVLFLITHIIVSITAKTFSGIIRFTSTKDSIRVLFAVTLSNLSFYCVSKLSLLFYGILFLPNQILLLNILFSFTVLMLYRLIIKYTFLYFKNLNLDKVKVVIYGAGETGMAIKRTFDHDDKVNKTIIAFIDDDIRKIGKRLDGVLIIGRDGLANLLTKSEVDEMIFAAHSISLERKTEMIDICLEHNVSVLTVPSTKFWIEGAVKTTQIKTINIESLLNRETINIDIDLISEELTGKRVLITGAAGSIGSELVRQILKFNTGLVILCEQSETALHELYLELSESNASQNFHPFVGDVRDAVRMEHLFSTYKPHSVYHAAAYKHVPLMEESPSEAIKTNVLGTQIVADMSVKYGVKKFVMISTDKAVNPTNIMGASKRIAEIYVQSLNNSLIKDDFKFTNRLEYINNLEMKPSTRFITTRFGNVLGSNGSVIPRFTKQIENGGPVTVTHPEITRFFMTIPEACKLVLEAGCMGKGGEIYLFDMGKSIKIVELAKKMIRLAGLTPNKDIKIEYIGLRPGEKLYEELLNDNENTIPTHHEKIMIGKVREYVFDDVDAQIYHLILAAQHNHDRDVVLKMKKLVKEYKSENSIFEELDNIVSK